MKQYLDERQSQVLSKYAMGSFSVMYIACAVAIVVQLYVGNGDLSLVFGETIIMLAGGIVYLYGAIKTGTFSANGICKGKSSLFVNISLSVLISAVFCWNCCFMFCGTNCNECIFRWRTEEI